MKGQDLIVTPQGAWFRGRRFPCVVGRGGIIPPDRKREGDGATPAGVLTIVGMLYRPDRIPAPATWAKAIARRALWSDDPLDPDYNQLVQAPHGFSHERLRRADPVYDLILITNWNWPVAVPGCGSAIFLHQWRRPGVPTAGCIAFARADLRWIARRLGPGSRVLVRG